jgi:hypothetical protein
MSWPGVVTCEVDMAPTEWREVLEQVWVDVIVDWGTFFAVWGLII